MVKWIGKLLLKRSKNAWMDMLPVSTMRQEQGETQYSADVDMLIEVRQETRSYCSGSDFASDQRS